MKDKASILTLSVNAKIFREIKIQYDSLVKTMISRISSLKVLYSFRLKKKKKWVQVKTTLWHAWRLDFMYYLGD